MNPVCRVIDKSTEIDSIALAEPQQPPIRPDLVSLVRRIRDTVAQQQDRVLGRCAVWLPSVALACCTVRSAEVAGQSGPDPVRDGKR
jgi:hypothetical protein